MLLATLLVHSRYLLLDASLAQYLRDRPLRELLVGAFLTADEDWALTVGAFEAGDRDVGILLGSGVAIWACRVGATALGAGAGDLGATDVLRGR